MTNNYYKPDAVSFKLSDNVFTAVVAVHGQTKVLPNGKKITLTTDLFKKLKGSWKDQPAAANHIKQFGLGKILSDDIGPNGELIMTFSVTDQKALDLMRNDAFMGFSVGFDPKTAVLDANGVLTDAKSDHLGIMFFPFRPVCSKDTCNVIFSENGTARSCLCAFDEPHHVAAIKFSKDIYSRSDAREWLVANDKSDSMLLETEDYYVFSLMEYKVEDSKESFIDEGIVGLIVFGDVESDVSILPVEPKKEEDTMCDTCGKGKEGTEFNASAPNAPPAVEATPEPAPADTKKAEEIEARLRKVELADKLAQDLEAEKKRVAEIEAREKALHEKIAKYEEAERKAFIASMPKLTPEIKEGFEISAEKWEDITDIAVLRRVKKAIDTIVPKNAEENPEVTESESPKETPKTDPAKDFWTKYLKR